MQGGVDFSRGWTRVFVLGDCPGPGGARLCGPALTFTRSAPPARTNAALAHAAREGYDLGKELYPEEDVVVTARLSDDEDQVWVIVGHFPPGAEPDQGSSDDARELEFLHERRELPQRQRRAAAADGGLPSPPRCEGPAR